MERETTAVKNIHLILGHPILWCLLTLPISMILSQAIATLPKMLLAKLMQPGDLCELLDTLIGGLCYILVGIALVKLGQKAYGDSFHLGLTAKRLKESLLLSVPSLMLVISNIIPAFTGGPWQAPGAIPLLSAALSGVVVGVAEELCSRNFVIENAMQAFRAKKNAILLALVLSSVGFGALHLLNLTNDANNPSMVFVQVFAAMVMGFFFGVIYVRTRNLWGAILMHALVDVSAFCFNGAEETTAPTLGLILNYVVLSAILLVIGIFMLRKSRWADMLALWEIPQTTENEHA